MVVFIFNLINKMVIKKDIKVENVFNIERFKKNSIIIFCIPKIHVLWCTPVYTLNTGLE